MAAERNSTKRFGDRAREYAAFRPGYPDRAIDELLAGLGAPASLVVADVGAGTGISARAIAERGARVIAIEPNAAMREAAHPHARVTWQDGTGEATRLEDAGVDVACACQAFHWFATPEALEEFRRISRRRAALLQNERDERDPFTRAFGDVVRAYATDDTEALRMHALDVFAAFPNAEVSRSSYGHSQRFDLEGLLGRAASASYLPKTGAAAQSLRSDLAALFERFAGAGSAVEMALVTYLLRADW
ncbi:MAG: class I SAM-dependent methyltransferase [Vulcanimicrobiaceae bacterium]